MDSRVGDGSALVAELAKNPITNRRQSINLVSEVI